MKDEVDPKRFTGKSFTRRKTFPDSKDDYSIRIDGLTAWPDHEKDRGPPEGGLVVVPHRPLFSRQHAAERRGRKL